MLYFRAHVKIASRIVSDCSNECRSDGAAVRRQSAAGVVSSRLFLQHVAGRRQRARTCRLLLVQPHRHQLANALRRPPPGLPLVDRSVKHTNSRFESIRFVMLFRIDSFCLKNRPFDSLVVMQFEQKQLRNAYYKITLNLLFEYQCTSGKFIRLPNRIE